MTFQLPSGRIAGWFRKRFDRPTPVQAAAWPHLFAGRNALIVSPTGTGKTLAAFFAVLHELEAQHAAGTLESTIHALYVSPLRALSYDLEKNLNTPLGEVYGESSPIRVGLRTGDTPSAERQKQLARPPHILLTTPESLCLLLSQSKWLPALASVRWVIVDEIHALAENKRGAHLSISLERLAQAGRSPARPQRIGLSATVAPLDRVAGFLVGAGRDCAMVDVSSAKRIHLAVYTPLGPTPYPQAGFSGVRMMRELGKLINRHRTTLVFTNTRSGAESATFWLRTELPALAGQIECHHASLDRDVRLEVEDRLKRGELRAVVCSTSLELGIDIGSVDLVVMLATPKGVTKALQRTGRSGHDIRSVSRGLLMATNMNDLVECCATVLLARARHLDPVRLPHAPLDVLAQHLVSMGCTRRWPRAEALALVRRAWPYRELTESDFNDVLDYLAGGGKSLRQQYTDVFGKIALEDDAFETRGGTVRRDFLQNVGVIPNEGVVNVRLKSRSLGTVEETFIRRLTPGDVFTLGGRPVRLERVGMMEAFVARADHAAPTVPRWNANKFPLSSRVASEIVAFRSELRRQFETGESPESLVHWIGQRLACGKGNARIIHQMYAAQHRLSEIPTAEALLIEEVNASDEERQILGEAGAPLRPGQQRRGFRRRRAVVEERRDVRHYFVHALIGRAANDALSRVVAVRLSRARGGNAVATPDDYGFVLSVNSGEALTTEDLRALLAPPAFGADLELALARSELLKYHFRNAAQTGLMVYRNFFGDQKPVRALQFSSEVIFNVLIQHEPDHVLLREARRDAEYTFLDRAGAEAFLRAAADRPLRLRTVAHVPPLSFAMYATRMREVLLVENPAETIERLYHHWWSLIAHEPVAT